MNIRTIAILLTITFLIIIGVAPSLGQENNTEIVMEAKENYELFTKQEKQIQEKIKKIKYKTGWIKGNNINVRKRPNKKSKIVKQLYYGEKIKYTIYNNKWLKIKSNNKTYYIYFKYVSKKKLKSTTKIAPSNTIKTYMDYHTITNTTSQQYKLQQKAYSGNYGIRQVDGRYCIALGSYYTSTIGVYVDIILKNGTVIPCIVADCKADSDTDSKNIMHPDGSLVEFVVDVNTLNHKAKIMGDMSYVNNKWKSEVKKVKIYNKKEKI